MDKDGNFFEHYNLSKKEEYKPVKIEKGDAVLLSECSPFYRQTTNDVEVNIDRSLRFPPKIQLCYGE